MILNSILGFWSDSNIIFITKYDGHTEEKDKLYKISNENYNVELFKRNKINEKHGKTMIKSDLDMNLFEDD